MGVDSGLPDFRGNEGFWRAYPPFAQRGLSFVDLANPQWFDDDPSLAWGFYGHRLQLYRRTEPHQGFALLQRLAEPKGKGVFAFTSNVDGQFQRAGFAAERVLECHGSIHHLQCSRPCSDDIWPAEGLEVQVDDSTFCARPPLPECPRCGALARPNILMFGDGDWLSQRMALQEQQLREWVTRIAGCRVAVIECGAGRAVPTVRWTCERMARQVDTPLIRINPRESQGPAGTISIASGALDALEQIAQRAL